MEAGEGAGKQGGASQWKEGPGFEGGPQRQALLRKPRGKYCGLDKWHDVDVLIFYVLPQVYQQANYM